MNPLQRCKVHTSLQFGRLRSNRFGENRLTDACGAVFSKQAAPRSHAFFSCHEPLPPGTRCGGAPRRALLAPARRATCNPAQLRNYVPANYRSRRNIKDSYAETQKSTIPKHRRQPRWSRPAGSIGSRGGSYCRRLSSAAAGQATDCKYGN